MDYEWLLTRNIKEGTNSRTMICASKTKAGFIQIFSKDNALLVVRDQIIEHQRELKKLQGIEATILQNG